MASPTPPAATLLPSPATSTEKPTVTSVSHEPSTLPNLNPVPWTVRDSARAELCITIDAGLCNKAARGLRASPEGAAATESTERGPSTAIPNAAEIGPGPTQLSPATRYAPRVLASIWLDDPGLGLGAIAVVDPLLDLELDAIGQPAVVCGETGKEEGASASYGPPGFVPVVDIDGIPPLSPSDEIDIMVALERAEWGGSGMDILGSSD